MVNDKSVDTKSAVPGLGGRYTSGSLCAVVGGIEPDISWEKAPTWYSIFEHLLLAYLIDLIN